jgi:hypothetical protein
MKAKVVLYLFSALIGLNLAVSAAQSGREFIDRVYNFKIILVGNWQPVPYLDAAGRQKTEFVGENRRSGLLRVTKESLRGRSLSEIVQCEEEDLRGRFALVSFGHEPFTGGSLSGIRVSTYYLEDHRRIIGTYYFLKDGDYIWGLRFIGQPGSGDMAVEVTDKLARSFCSECPIF